jgi:hypothetical protein
MRCCPSITIKKYAASPRLQTQSHRPHGVELPGSVLILGADPHVGDALPFRSIHVFEASGRVCQQWQEAHLLDSATATYGCLPRLGPRWTTELDQGAGGLDLRPALASPLIKGTVSGRSDFDLVR